MGNRLKTYDSDKMLQISLKYGIYILFAIIVILLMLVSPSFRTSGNITNVFLQITTHAVLGIGMTFVIMTGGIDVSIGGIMVCAGSVYTVLAQSGLPETVCIISMFAVSILVGLINGVSVAYLKLPAFLATLATQFMCTGVALVLTGGVSFRDLGDSFTFFGKTKLFTLPIQIWVIGVLFFIGYLILHKTIYGKKIIAVGGNVNAARVSGIDDKKIVCSTYVLMGLISGLAGYLNMARLGSYYAAMGDGIEFMVIAAVVIGGTSMVGGSGSMIGTLVGTMLIGVINNALNLFKIDAEWQLVAKGLIIFVAVLFDAIKNRMKKAD